MFGEQAVQRVFVKQPLSVIEFKYVLRHFSLSESVYRVFFSVCKISFVVCLRPFFGVKGHCDFYRAFFGSCNFVLHFFTPLPFVLIISYAIFYHIARQKESVFIYNFGFLVYNSRCARKRSV